MAATRCQTDTQRYTSYREERRGEGRGGRGGTGRRNEGVKKYIIKEKKWGRRKKRYKR